MEELLDIIAVTTHDDFTLDLVFEKPFTRLCNSPLFFRASVQYGTVVWPGNFDIAPETLWNRSVPA